MLGRRTVSVPSFAGRRRLASPGAPRRRGERGALREAPEQQLQMTTASDRVVVGD